MKIMIQVCLYTVSPLVNAHPIKIPPFINIINFVCGSIGVTKRKKYVMVTTRKDGTKVKEYLDPEDPRIAEIGITRKLKTPSNNTARVADAASSTNSLGKGSNAKLR